jgi:hypothetical protein
MQESLRYKFAEIFKGTPHEDNKEIGIDLMIEIIEKYMTVTNNEFRKKLCVILGKEKKKNHRVQILTNKAQTAATTLSKKQAMTTTPAKGSNAQHKTDGDARAAILTQLVSSPAKVQRVSSPVKEQRATGKRRSTGTGKIRSKSKKKASEGQNDTICAGCLSIYPQGEKDWIGCDCNNWYHRTCAGLKDDIDWEDYNGTNKDWICPECLGI